MSKPNWRPVLGYEGLYEVGADGRVRRVAGSKTAPVARELKQYRHRTGYMMVRLYQGGRGTGVGKYVHRLVAQALLGPVPAGRQVNHVDGDKANNAIGNLEYVTAKENIAHAEKRGLRPKARGVDHGSTHLTEMDVLAIRVLSGMTAKHRHIADYFGISVAQVSRIVNRKQWRHI